MTKKKKNKSSGKLILWNLAGAAALLLTLVVGSYFALKIFTHHGEQIPVPNFYGMTLQEAQNVASQTKIRIEVVDSVFVKRLNRGVVYRQNPDAGEKVKEGRLVRLVVNTTNVKYVEMPNLVGFSLRQAIAELSAKNLKVGTLMYKSDIATNNVLEQQLGGSAIEEGVAIETETAIDLVLGLNGRDKTFIPNTIGHKSYEAEDILHNNFLNVGRLHYDSTIRSYADSISAFVYSQYPIMSAQDVNMGSRVDLFLTLDESKLPVVEESEEKK